MPFGVRSSLVIALLCSSVAAHAADGSTWTDPPPRPPEAAKVTPDAPAAQAARPETPAALSTPTRKSAKVQRRKTVAPKRYAARPRPVVVVDHTIRRPSRIVGMRPMRPAPRRYAYPVYSQAGVPMGYDDPRLDRLGSAVGSGYLVMHRRTVEYPDGRMIRYYRPVEADGDE